MRSGSSHEFCLASVSLGAVGYPTDGICWDHSENGLTHCIRPVVTLNSNVSTETVSKITEPVTETWDDSLGYNEGW